METLVKTSNVMRTNTELKTIYIYFLRSSAPIIFLIKINYKYFYLQIKKPKPKWSKNGGYDLYEALHETPKENIFKGAYCLMDPQRRWDKLSGLL